MILGFTIDDQLLNEVAKRSTVLPTQTHKFAWNLVKAVQSTGAMVSLLSVLPVPNYPHYPEIVIRSRRFEDHGVKGITLGFLNLLGFKHLTRFYSCITKGRRYVRQQHPEMILVHGVHTPFLLFARLMKFAFDVRICVVMTDPPGVTLASDGPAVRTLKRLDQRVVRRLARGFDGVIGLTSQLVADFVPTARALIVEGFVDPQLARPVAKSEANTDEFRVAYAGGISAEYGVENLVKAFQDLFDPHFRLALYGRGPLDSWVVEKSKIDPRITHYGLVAHEELMSALRGAQLLVNPRPVSQQFVKYSFPSKLLEYLALGVPVVTTRLPGIPDDYFPYMQIAADDSVAALVKAIQAVRSNQTEAFDRAARAQAYVVSAKSNAAQGARLAAFFTTFGRSAGAVT